MKIQRKWIPVLTCMVAMLAASIGIFAQDTKQKKPRVEREVIIGPQAGVTVEAAGEVHAMPPDVMWHKDPADSVFVFFESEMAFEGKVVKGAPYSAQAVRESAQTLADGNRIVRKTTATIYRDSEGRTRREHTSGSVGPWAAAGEPSQTIMINDPVAGVGYVLIPDARIARKRPHFAQKMLEAELLRAKGAEELAASPEDRAKLEAKRKAEQGTVEGKIRRSRRGNVSEDVVIATPGEPVHMFSSKLPEPKTEALGKQTVEGVEAEGTRSTITIPAGEIGNEQPINIVHERWYSPELQTVVMTRHSDPRFGENTYRLTNINRSEPARSLFEVPSDYTIKEGGPRIRARKPSANDEK